ncbi:MAG TPA: sigma-70 family RNA polymerase sigma factor [Spirochaetota bacterium]|nr:sigma-70 family RNA polymerase sigma factor [Spirochaetota bacterium]HPI90398.1 sigma-70 family RNA polymerase sigma factor [Spirochaetota bacterium]HPR48519.1 sigma-70 family RNA polymerase sigma factor [Spirochaetota bacterium]
MFWKNRKFAEVFSDHYSIVFNVVYSKINNIHEAEDICQDLFIKLYEKMDTVENPRKWLLGAIRFAVLNYYKSRRAEPVDIEELFQDMNLAFVNGFRDARIIINDVLENECNYESEKDILLFNLIAVNNYSYEEAGRELGMSKRQVRYRYGKTVNRLLDSLSKKGIKNIEDIL